MRLPQKGRMLAKLDRLQIFQSIQYIIANCCTLTNNYTQHLMHRFTIVCTVWKVDTFTINPSFLSFLPSIFISKKNPYEITLELGYYSVDSAKCRSLKSINGVIQYCVQFASLSLLVWHHLWSTVNKNQKEQLKRVEKIQLSHYWHPLFYIRSF